jgi:hypothetical protein
MNDALASLMIQRGGVAPTGLGANDAALQFQILMEEIKRQGKGATGAVKSGASQGLGYATDALTMVGPMSGRFAGGYLQGANLLPTASGLSGASKFVGAGGLPTGKALINPVTGKLGKAAMAGKLLGRATPYMPAIGNVLEGDLVGAGGALAGAAIGSVVPVIGTGAGAIIGGMLGEPVARGVGKLAGGVVGIDASNPLSGPDWSVGPLALTPYARTKKQVKKAIELQNLHLPLYNKIADQQLKRQMALQSLGIVDNALSQSGQTFRTMISSPAY